MRNYPDTSDKWEREELKQLNAPQWMVDLLKLNPSYCSWGPHEDYMIGSDRGWASSKTDQRWDEIKNWGLDDLNECVNFYFELERESKNCDNCGSTGYHRDALWVSESFYSHSSPFTVQNESELNAQRVMQRFGASFSEPLGRNSFPSEAILLKYSPEFRVFCDKMVVHREWQNDTTEDEREALKVSGRDKCGLIGHDAINRGILIEARCKRFGIPLHCEKCSGRGSLYTEPEAHLNLILWYLHPRKGCSRGVEVKYLSITDIPSVLEYLSEAAKRNAQRFSKIHP